MSWRRLLAAAVAATSMFLALASSAGAEGARVLDDFASLAPWQAVASDDVVAQVSSTPESRGLRLAFDFAGHAGYASARRALPLELPDNFELTLRLRGQAPPNDLQVKLIDASGDNVWWYRRTDHAWPADWQVLRIERRQVEFAWGPTTDRRLRSIATIEITVNAGSGGGSGYLDLDDLALRPLPPAPEQSAVPSVAASKSGRTAGAVVDGDPATAWRPGVQRGKGATLTFDFGAPRALGGLTLHWLAGYAATDYDVERSDDGKTWRLVRAVRGAIQDEQSVYWPDAEARYLRLRVPAPAGPRPVDLALAEVRFDPSSDETSANAFMTRVARRSQRGAFPRAWLGEQSYWTVVGTDGGADEGLLSEDGAFELRRAAPSLEPFVQVDDTPYDWADVTTSHALADGYLPMPSVRWTHAAWRLDTRAFADGAAGSDRAIVRYDYTNTSAAPQRVALAVAVRPLQVNPATQFLNGAGGVAPIRALDWNGQRLRINEALEVWPLVPPDDYHAASFEAAPTPDDLLRHGDGPAEFQDTGGLASAAFVYRRTVPPQATVTVTFVVPWTAPATDDPAPAALTSWLDDRERAAAADWHARLDRTVLGGPPAAQRVFDTVRTALGHILINRDGAALQPGSRSYERSWIRDGALSSATLLRLGHAPVARDFLRWYADHLFSSGKVPCCVDRRGSDPVPENDSNGEFLWLAAELDRYTHDDATRAAIWPRVSAAFGYLDRLRLEERTDANLAEPGRRAFYGLVPASISHEGYSAKPMHSYWDDFWVLAGLKGARELAAAQGDASLLQQARQSEAQFRDDLARSLEAAMAMHGIDYLPGCAELGDFDATSTTIAVAPVGEIDWLPKAPLHATFERYWRDFVARRAGQGESPAYTPYEWRVVGTFARLGWRTQANEALAYFMDDRRPAAWNQWAEVVGLDAREPRFVGDMPHGWVASDFIRSVLDMLVYERESDEALVLAAGVDPAWLDGPGLTVQNLQTPWGPFGYRLRRTGPSTLQLHVDPGRVPPGGVVIRVGGVDHRYRKLPVDVTLHGALGD
jgi:hypothetical protein